MYVCVVTLSLQIGHRHDSQVAIGHVAHAEGIDGGAGNKGGHRGGGSGGGG